MNYKNYGNQEGKRLNQEFVYFQPGFTEETATFANWATSTGIRGGCRKCLIIYVTKFIFN
jgi:hypothetical protein